MILNEEKGKRNKIKAAKDKDTKKNNRINRETLSAIRIILGTTDLDADMKIHMIQSAMDLDQDGDATDEDRLVVSDM